MNGTCVCGAGQPVIYARNVRRNRRGENFCRVSRANCFIATSEFCDGRKRNNSLLDKILHVLNMKVSHVVILTLLLYSF